MSEWKSFTEEVSLILNSNLLEKDYKLKIQSIKNIAKKIKHTPEHFGNLKGVIEKDRKNIKILDHGCGSCVTILFLFLKGFRNIWGVTVNFDNDKNTKVYVKKVNKLISNLQKKNTTRIFIYDGKKLPFKNNSFDFIFSQQVLEHVTPFLRKDFISEEKRVLKNTGFLYHQIPHRLVPYEAHTKKWIMHWLPKKYTLKLLGKKTNEHYFTENYLFLQWPWTLKNNFKRLSLFYLDITHFRLKKRVKGREFGFFGNTVRIIFFTFFKIPFIGRFLAKSFSQFFMLELLIVKKNNKFLLKSKELLLKSLNK